MEFVFLALLIKLEIQNFFFLTTCCGYFFLLLKKRLGDGKKEFVREGDSQVAQVASAGLISAN